MPALRVMFPLEPAAAAAGQQQTVRRRMVHPRCKGTTMLKLRFTVAGTGRGPILNVAARLWILPSTLLVTVLRDGPHHTAGTASR
jgi:hypothetical protein